MREPLSKFSPELVEVELGEVLPQRCEHRLGVVGGGADFGYIVAFAEDVGGALDVEVVWRGCGGGREARQAVETGDEIDCTGYGGGHVVGGGSTDDGEGVLGVSEEGEGAEEHGGCSSDGSFGGAEKRVSEQMGTRCGAMLATLTCTLPKGTAARWRCRGRATAF